MSEQPSRRAADKGAPRVALQVAAQASHSFWGWFEHHHIDALAVLVVSLWLTVRIVEWALEVPYHNRSYTGTEVALIIGAVLTPLGAMQVFLFKFYVDLKGKNGLLK